MHAVLLNLYYGFFVFIIFFIFVVNITSIWHNICKKNINTSKLNICPGIMDILCLAFAVVFVFFSMLIAVSLVVDVWRPMAIWRQLEASKQNSVKALRKWCWRIRAKNAAHWRIRFSYSYCTRFSKFPRWSLKCWMLIWNAAIKIKWFLIKWNADFIAFSDNLL